MRLSNLLLSGTAGFAVIMGLAPAHAQTAPAGGSQIEELIVTGRAGALDRRRVEASYAITTLDAAALRLQAPMSTAEVFKAIPGFWVEASGGEASNNVRTRGIPTDGYSSVTSKNAYPKTRFQNRVAPKRTSATACGISLVKITANQPTISIINA